jgi:hypothetical protein
MEFDDRSTVEVLKKGDVVTVVGQIKSVDTLWVDLKDCELEKP